MTCKGLKEIPQKKYFQFEYLNGKLGAKICSQFLVCCRRVWQWILLSGQRITPQCSLTENYSTHTKIYKFPKNLAFTEWRHLSFVQGKGINKAQENVVMLSTLPNVWSQERNW